MIETQMIHRIPKRKEVRSRAIRIYGWKDERKKADITRIMGR